MDTSNSLPKLFTGRYANRAIWAAGTPVRITLGCPKWGRWDETEAMKELAPPGYLFHINDRREFEPRYRKHLDRIGLETIAGRLGALADLYGRPLVLLCYEDLRKPDEWCHRLCFAQWWEDRTGEKVEEVAEAEPRKDPPQLSLML